MGKVFDALKKAEEERKAGRPVPPSSAGAQGPPEAAQAPASAGVALPEPPEGPRIEEYEAPRKGARPVPRRARSLRGTGVRESLRAAWAFVRNRGREIPDEETASVKRRIIQFDPYSPAAEQFRAIRTRIELLNEGGACRVLAVTSALPGEGKTLTAINLSLVMAMSLERRVVLVDCDLRKPQIHSTLGLGVEFGLTEVLRGEVPLERALIEMPKEGLTVLPAGALPSNPAELLGTQRLRETVAGLRDRFDYVILDTPAAIPVSDPEIVCNLADGVIFVVRAGSTPREQVLQAMDNFSRERIVGIVLNSSEAESAADPQG
jgi:capsular exopolysaccharide synthesis family protein